MQGKISLEKLPSVVTEILLRLKVKDAMSQALHTAKKTNTLKEAQNMMKEKRISGIPIVEGDRLLGIISVDDILNAFDKGYIDDPIEPYMTKTVVFLEDDMPLTFAISYFDKYSFGRFPVINKKKQLVGILTSRDILMSLVQALNQEIKELEDKIHPEHPLHSPNKIHREFFIKKLDFENAGKASFEIKKILKEENIPQKIIRRAAIASYELEINIAIHSEGGKMLFDLEGEYLVITAQDNGPGIADPDKVIKPGYSTANEWIRSLGFGAGMGLPNVIKVSDDFKIESEVGKGTTVKSIILLKEDD
ncbi:MAG: histidine kinase [Spirochaetes bacterium GWF1_51_8]|nr:MAG: histidine kinase [Spirochaetes bacterium GWF1_51_8]